MSYDTVSEMHFIQEFHGIMDCKAHNKWNIDVNIITRVKYIPVNTNIAVEMQSLYFLISLH